MLKKVAATDDFDHALAELGITLADIFVQTALGPGQWKIVTKDARVLYWPVELKPVEASASVPAKLKKS